VRGERQRLTRWRNPAASGSLAATTETSAIPLHVAVACAFVHNNEDLANQAKQRLAGGDPIAGQLTLQTGKTRRFQDITDADDAIGRMLETYCGDGLLYFPFHSLRRVEVLPKTSFIDHLMPKVQITDELGAALAYVPLLYAGSSTSPSPELRTGRGTVFPYLGETRRGHGQRDLLIDGGGLVGWHVISAIDFDSRSSRRRNVDAHSPGRPPASDDREVALRLPCSRERCIDSPRKRRGRHTGLGLEGGPAVGAIRRPIVIRQR